MANIYTCLNATGTIEGLSRISGNNTVKYTLSDITSGTVDGNASNGEYSKTEYGGINLDLSNFSGVCTVDSVSFKDIINTHYDPFKVHSVVLTQDEINTSYDDTQKKTYDILVDDNGNRLVDDNLNALGTLALPLRT